MPTARHRYQVTETEELERALDLAAKRWPGEPRSRLLLMLIEEGRDAVKQTDIADARRAAIRRVGGTYTDAFAPGYLERLRDDWPE